MHASKACTVILTQGGRDSQQDMHAILKLSTVIAAVRLSN